MQLYHENTVDVHYNVHVDNICDRLTFPPTLPNNWWSKREKLPPGITPGITPAIAWHLPGTISKGNGRYP